MHVADWDPSAVAAVLRTENRFPGGAVVGVLAVGHSQTRIWVLESELREDAAVAARPVVLAERRLPEVGSELFDRLLLERALERLIEVPGAEKSLADRLREPTGEPWSGLRQRLIEQVRRARGELTAWHSATVEVDDIPGLSPDGPLRLDRIELDNALRPYVLRMAREFGATIEESGSRPSLLDGIYLLGDGQMPLIVRSVYDVLGVSPTVGHDRVGAEVHSVSGFSEPVAPNGVRRVPVPGRPVSPPQGLSLRPTPPKPKSNGKRMVVPGTTTPKSEPTPVSRPSTDPDDAEVYRPVVESLVDAAGAEVAAVGSGGEELRTKDGEVASGAQPPVAEAVGLEEDSSVAGAAKNGTPIYGTPVNGTPVNGTPANRTSVNGTPVNGTPANGTPVNGLPVNGLPVNGLPVNETSVDEMPVDEILADEILAEETPASDQPAAAAKNGKPRSGMNGVGPKPAAQAAQAAKPHDFAPPELTDTGSLRLLRDEDDGFDENRLVGTPPPARTRRKLLVPVLGGVAVMAAASLIVVSLVNNDDSQNNEAASAGSPGAELSAASTAPSPSPTFSPTPEVVALPAVEGLKARTVGIAIALTWNEVEDADQYAVYRDPGTADEVVRTAATAKLTDRPGDGSTHTYAVVALDDQENEGEPSGQVEAKALAPYKKVQHIASEWTGIVPQRPNRPGRSGQVCLPKTNKLAGSDGRIVCRYPGGLTLTVFHYDAPGTTDRHHDDLAEGKGVKSGTWKGDPADEAGGRQLTGRRMGGAWRWWTYDSAPEYAVQVQWTGHSPAELAKWVNKRMPFHS